MPHIRYRKDGRYEAIFSYQNNRYSVYDKDKKILPTKINKKIKELKSLTYSKKVKNQNDLTLKKWYEIWLEEDKIPFLETSSIDNIKNYFNKHILPKLGNYILNELNKSTIQKFLNNIDRSRTKELITTYFKACITKAFKEKKIIDNPFDNIRIDNKLNNIKEAFTALEQKNILNYLKKNNNDFYILTLLYLCLGCRRNELLSITQKDIYKDYILIHQQKTKRYKPIKYVKITNELKTFLLNNLKILNKYRPNYITQKFKIYLNKINIDGNLNCLRHSFATNHYYLETSLKQVQEWLGHTSIQTTANIYTNINPTIDPKKEKKLIIDLYKSLYYYVK